MPLATNQAWLKSYGNLPWWRSGASYSGKEYPKALGSSSVRRYARSKNGKRYDFDPNQPRDDKGMWTEGGGSGGRVSKDQTDSSAFKSWFGDSKVVDADGKPLVVYHGTNDIFSEFNPARAALSTRGASGSLGVFFTPDPIGAGHYGSGEQGSIIAAYLSISNPITLSEEAYRRATNSKADTRAFREEILQKGYDGAIVPHLNEWIAFHSTQIKSAIGNKGTFDPKNPNITYSQYEQVSLSREPTAYEKRVDFAAIVTGLDHLEAQGLTRIRALLAAARDRLTALVGRKLGENRLTTKFVNDLELRGLGQLVPTLREIMRAAFRQGEQGAKDELKLAQGVVGKKPKSLSRNDPAWGIKAIMLAAMAEHPDWTGAQIVAEVKGRQDTRQYQVRHTLEGLPPEKALEFFEQKALLWGADIRDPLLSDIKNILFDAIKMGRPLRDIQAQLSAAFLPWLGDPNQLIDEEMLTPYRLETLVRTNVNEALNEGRKAMFQPEVDSGFITAFQYSAILDKRTTEVCKYLDRKMFRPDSPEMDRLSAPRHFNCRSLWTMVTRADGPVQFIRADEVAKGVLLSGKGFSQESGCRDHGLTVELDDVSKAKPVSERVEDRVSEPKGIRDFTEVIQPQPVSVCVEGPVINLPEQRPIVVHAAAQSAPNVDVHIEPTQVTVPPANIAVRVEAPIVHVPAPVVEVLPAQAPVVHVNIDSSGLARELAQQMQGAIMVNVAPPNVVVNVPPQEPPHITVEASKPVVIVGGLKKATVRHTMQRDDRGMLIGSTEEREYECESLAPVAEPAKESS